MYRWFRRLLCYESLYILPCLLSLLQTLLTRSCLPSFSSYTVNYLYIYIDVNLNFVVDFLQFMCSLSSPVDREVYFL